jgi:hypothetical protein
MATAKQKAVLSAVVSQATLVSQRHDVYVEQFVTRANEELYVMLADMMQVCEDIWASNCEEYLVKNIRKELRDKWDIKTQKNTSTTALVVRYITRGTRQLVHNYAKVIDNAKEAGVNATQLAEYIKSRGGIDEARKKMVSAETKRELSLRAKTIQANTTKHLTNNKRIGSLNLSNKSNGITAGCYDVRFTVSLSTYVDGEERVVATIYPSSTIVEDCLSLYKLSCEAAAMDDGTGKFANFCKEYGLNMDVIHRWMRDNNMEKRIDAENELRQIYGIAAAQEAANEVYELTA